MLFCFLPVNACKFAPKHMTIKPVFHWLIASTLSLFLVFVGAKINFATESTASELDEVVNYEIFPFSEYEKLEKLEEQQVCKIWANNVKSLLKRLVFQLENSPGEGWDELVALAKQLVSPPDSEAVSLFEGEEQFTAQTVATVLKGRVLIWEQVLLLLEHEQVNGPYGVIPQKSFLDIEQLYEKSGRIRSSLLSSKNGQPWVQFLQLTPLHDQLGHVVAAKTQGLADPVEKYARDFQSPVPAVTNNPGFGLSEEECRRISLLANNILLMKERASLTPEQSQLLESPPIRDWLDEMETWRSNPLHPLDLLAAYECYHQYRGSSDSSRLSDLTRQMLGSQSRDLQMFGQAVQNEFSHAHIKLYVSNYLINTMLPKLKPEYGSVNENMGGLQVVGTRRANTQLHVTMIPDPSRLFMSFNFNGQVATQTSTSSGPATIYNESYGTYTATKQVELTSRGIVADPANVTANSAVKLKNIETDLDIVPIVGGLIQGIAKDQYDSQQQKIQADARAKVSAQAKQRIDSETDTQFRELNNNLDRMFFSVLRRHQTSLEQYEAKTSEEWLHTSWYLSTPYSLGSDTKEPTTPKGTIADLKVHELGINAVLERLELAGKQMTLRELKHYLIGMLGRPDLEIPEEEHDHVIIAFADLNPVGVRFLQNRVELSLNMKRLQVDARSWENFCVIAGYVPEATPEGIPCLVHRGTVQLDGRLTLSQQVVLRTIFSKIFLHAERIPLRPKLFDNDERFAELATGHVRIDNGWIAIALLPQKNPVIPQQKQQPVTVRNQQPQPLPLQPQPVQVQPPQQVLQQPPRPTIRPAVTQTIPPDNSVRR